MAIMAPAAPEQALMGLTGCCNTGPAFVATETKNSPCPIQSLGSSSAFLNWPALQPMANSHSTMATPLGSPSPWEHLLNYPSGGFEELPLWSSKAAEGHDGILQAPAKSGIATASSAVLQPQVLEAVEGTRTGANMDALVASVAAAPHENDRRAPCSEGVHQAGPSSTTAASPARSPLRLRDHHPATNSRKRKKDRSSPSPKRSEQEGKRCGRESGKAKGRERSCSETSGESGGRGKEKNRVRKKQQQQQECSKQDYIHVRARRGQATDSHSLAERVRREKMSERMKFLQDLVPGCRKVTGKAVMLDEIINYVQSLQRQVENLSMKLASVSPTQSSHWTLESLLSNKEILQSQFSNTMASSCAPRPFGMMQPPPAVGVQQQPGLQLPFGFDFRSSCNGNGLEHVSRNATTLSPPIAALADLTPLRPFDTNVPQFTGRDGELQSVVHMGLHQQDQLGSFAGHLHGRLPVGRMKVEF